MEGKGDNIPKELELRNLISRDLEQQEYGKIFRGPIKRVSISQEDFEGKPNKVVSFYLEWVAEKTPTGWVKWEPPEEIIDPDDESIRIARINPEYGAMYEDEEGVFHGEIPYIGTFLVLKEGDSLKREDVSGMEASETDSKNV